MSKRFLQEVTQIPRRPIGFDRADGVDGFDGG